MATAGADVKLGFWIGLGFILAVIAVAFISGMFRS